MDLTKLDSIKLTADGLPKLLRWRDEHKEEVRHFPTVLKEGVITYEKAYFQYFKDEVEFVHHEIIIQEKCVLSFDFDKKGWGVTNMSFDPDSVLLQDYTVNNAIQDAITVHASVMAYMAQYGSDKDLVNKVSHAMTAGTVVSKTNPSKKLTIRLTKNVYNIGFKVGEFTMDKENKTPAYTRGSYSKYERHTPSWTVRGHWRTKKDGSKVWVNGFTRRAQSGEVVPKEYKI